MENKNIEIVELKKKINELLLLFLFIWSFFIISYIKIYKNYKNLDEKIKQIELDYKFLKYNTDQLNEIKDIGGKIL